MSTSLDPFPLTVTARLATAADEPVAGVPVFTFRFATPPLTVSDEPDDHACEPATSSVPLFTVTASAPELALSCTVSVFE